MTEGNAAPAAEQQPPQEAQAPAAPAAPADTGTPQAATPDPNAADVWYGGAEPEMQGFIQNKGWNSPIDSVKAYQELEKFHGVPSEQLIKLPGDPNDSEAMGEVYKKLGRPDDPSAYEINLGDAPVDEHRMEAFKQGAHALGLNNAQVQALAELDAEYSQQAFEQYNAEREIRETAELNSLKQEWGDGFEERAELGRRFVRANLPDGVDKVETLDAIEKAIGTATMLKLFANAGYTANQSEDNLPTTEGDRPFGYTPEQAMADKKALMDSITADKERLANYNNGVGPDIDKMKRLNAIITGNR